MWTILLSEMKKHQQNAVTALVLSSSCFKMEKRYSFIIMILLLLGCILSPFSCNNYLGYIMGEVLEGFGESIKVGDRTVYDLSFADDVALFARSANGLQELLNRTQVASKDRGLKLNVAKTKVMFIAEKNNQDDFEITLEGERVEIVKEVKDLGNLITPKTYN